MQFYSLKSSNFFVQNVYHYLLSSYWKECVPSSQAWVEESVG